MERWRVGNASSSEEYSLDDLLFEVVEELVEVGVDDSAEGENKFG